MIYIEAQAFVLVAVAVSMTQIFFPITGAKMTTYRRTQGVKGNVITPWK
jgi:hypothetical protein